MTSLGPWHGWRIGQTSHGSGRMNVWDPFGFGSSSIGPRRDDTTALASAHVDWRETDKFHIFRADNPGVRKEEVKVHVEDGNILQISGERTKEEEEKSDKWHRFERRRGSFTRRFRPRKMLTSPTSSVALENGVLTVMVPKKETDQETRGNVRYIDIA